MRARDERVGKKQADRKGKIDRYVKEEGTSCEEVGSEGAGAETRRRRLGRRVHAALARRAPLLAREVGAEHVFVRLLDGREGTHDAVGWRSQLRRPELHARRHAG